MKRLIRCEHQIRGGVQTPGCGAPIVLVMVVPDNPTPGIPRKKIPLDATYDQSLGIPPSHAVSIDWSRCRPLSPGERPAPSEHPALTHFATCPHRRTQ